MTQLTPIPFRFEPVGHRYFLGEIQLPSITTILKVNGFYTEWSMEPEFLRRGTRIHFFTEYFDRDDLDWTQIADEELGYVIAWERFRKQTGFAPTLIEEMRYHPVFLFAGRLDRAGIFPDGTKAIVEIKTGKIAPATAFQTAAQEMLLGEPGYKRMAVELHANGTYAVESFGSHRDGNMFLSALSLYTWRKNNNLLPQRHTS